MAYRLCPRHFKRILLLFLTVWLMLTFLSLAYFLHLMDGISTPDQELGLEFSNRETHQMENSTAELVPAAEVIYSDMVGPGQNGDPVLFSEDDLTPSEVSEMKKLYHEHSFNTYISDLVSVHRKLKDNRPPECKAIKYSDDLPPVSVVIPFRNEHLSVLLRTIYSILETTPSHLLQEMILVDDGSTSPSLKGRLKLHVQSVPRVQLIRLSESHGVMTARQIGIKATTSDIIVIMDSHMEVVSGWLEPIISRLLENPKALVCTNIGQIHRDNFEFYATFGGDHTRNPFFTAALEQTLTLFQPTYMKSRSKTTDPIKYPTVSGTGIGFNKTFFNQLGGFDPGMRVWGTEQMELSVKYWTCGGTVEMIPCSYVGHVYRERVIWKTGTDGLRNKLRVALVWMDEYKDMVFEYNPGIENIDPGDITGRQRIRRDNKCKSFQYYLDEIRKFTKFYLHFNRRANGEIKSKVNTSMCVTIGNVADELILLPCDGSGFQKFFELSDTYQLRNYEDCLRPKHETHGPLVMERCTLGDESEQIEEWEYKQDGSLRHRYSGKCITAIPETLSVSLQQCDGSAEQQWLWNKLRDTFTD